MQYWRYIGVPIVLALLVALSRGMVPDLPASSHSGHFMIDEMGTKVELPVRPQRVLATANALDAIVLEMLPPERIAAVTADSQSPFSSLAWERARRVKNTLSRLPGTEEIVALGPDLVLMPDYTSADIVDGVRAMGIPVVVVKTPERVSDVHTMVRQVATALDEAATGERLCRRYDAEVAAVTARRDTIPPSERRSVFFTSSMTGYGGTGSLFDDMTGYTGLIHAAHAAGIPPKTEFTEERLILMNPDVIFVPTYSNRYQRQVEMIYADPALASVGAVRERRVYAVRPAYIYSSSVGIPEAMNAHQALGYGDRFPALEERYTAPVPEPDKGTRKPMRGKTDKVKTKS